MRVVDKINDERLLTLSNKSLRDVLEIIFIGHPGDPDSPVVCGGL